MAIHIITGFSHFEFKPFKMYTYIAYVFKTPQNSILLVFFFFFRELESKVHRITKKHSKKYSIYYKILKAIWKT